MPDQNLSFPSSDHFKYKTMKYVMQNASQIVIIDGRNVHTIDATVAKVSSRYGFFTFVLIYELIHFKFILQSLCAVVEDLHRLKKQVYFWHWNKKPMSVLCRLDPEMFALFKDAQTEEELLKILNTGSGNVA